MPMPINDKIESKQLKKQRKQTEGIKACKKHIWTRDNKTTRPRPSVDLTDSSSQEQDIKIGVGQH